jgi:hypothetical protein
LHKEEGDPVSVLEYKCPCCASALYFDDKKQKMTCKSCDNSFDVEALEQFSATETGADSSYNWEDPANTCWEDAEKEILQTFLCPSCGGELITDSDTAATFCPYCDSPTIIHSRLSQNVRPDGVLPFQTSKDDAKAAFLNFCKNKLLLPKSFSGKNRIEKITGIYVPFWLYDCDCSAEYRYKATRVHHWSDSRYYYTKTDHYLLYRAGIVDFSGIPMDASSKINNTIMESLEPFDYSKIVDFNTAYLSGYFADKYDVEAKVGHTRVQQRIDSTVDNLMRRTCTGYSSVMPTSQNLKVDHGRNRYVLLPVWMLHTNYNGKSYVFAMNGQTGKLTGSLPICSKQSWKWFGIVSGAVAALMTVVQFLAQ